MITLLKNAPEWKITRFLRQQIPVLPFILTGLAIGADVQVVPTLVDPNSVTTGTAAVGGNHELELRDLVDVSAQRVPGDQSIPFLDPNLERTRNLNTGSRDYNVLQLNSGQGIVKGSIAVRMTGLDPPGTDDDTTSAQFSLTLVSQEAVPPANLQYNSIFGGYDIHDIGGGALFIIPTAGAGAQPLSSGHIYSLSPQSFTPGITQVNAVVLQPNDPSIPIRSTVPDLTNNEIASVAFQVDTSVEGEWVIEVNPIAANENADTLYPTFTDAIIRVGPPPEPPTIQSQPTSRTVPFQEAALFVVEATGDPAPTFQWRKNGVPIPGATDQYLSVDPATNADVGTYDVVVTNPNGSVTSDPATLTVDAPFLLQPFSGRNPSDKLKASDPGHDERFGSAIDAYGRYAIVGAWRDAEVAQQAGAAYIFDLTTGHELHKLTASDGEALDWFGVSVGISGNRAIVGAYGEDGAGDRAGAAYVYDVTTGAELFKLTADDTEAGDAFGYSVGISGDYAIVGAYWLDGQTGATYVFDLRTGQQVQKLTADVGQVGSHFGWSVAISGHRALVGAFNDKRSGENGRGAVYVFDILSGDQLHRWKSSDGGARDDFGWAVDLSGNLAIIGAYYEGSAGTASGAAYIFDVATGTELHKLTPPNHQSYDRFGNEVAISGTCALVGSIVRETACVFDASSGTFLREFEASDRDPDHAELFGRFVGITGNIALVGAAQDDQGAGNSGAVFAHDLFRTQISTHPNNVTVNPGAQSVFSVVANNCAPLSYQWRKDGQPIPGATASAFTIPSSVEGDEGDYDVVVSSPYESLTSDDATLSVNDPVMITAAPMSITSTVGGGFSFSFSATGTGPFTYQWLRDGMEIPGATAATYEVAAANPWDIGRYSIRITNAVGAVSSAAATLDLTGVDSGLWQDLLAYYRFEGDGIDSAPFQIDAAEQGTVTYGSDRYGAPGMALSGATGVSDQNYLYGNGLDLAGASHTISFWLRTNYIGDGTNGNWLFRVGSEDAANKAIHVALDDSSAIRYGFFDDGHDDSTSVSDQQWHHLTVTYDQPTRARTLYVDGIPVSSDTAAGDFTGDDYFHFLGLLAPNIPVDLDDFRFYRRVLTPTQVNSLYDEEDLPDTTLTLASGSDSGSSNSDRLTNVKMPDFTGITDPGYTVGISSDLDGPLGLAVADASTGAWTIRPSFDLSEGAHTISVSRGAIGPSLDIEIDLTSPTAPTGIDLQSGSDSGSLDSDNITNDDTPTFDGDASADSVTVTLFSGVSEVGSATSNGPWAITSSALTDNTHTITAKATDAAGNISPASTGLNVTIDTTAPTLNFGKASGQADPTSTGPALFTATFSENVSGFDEADVSVGGSAGGAGTVSGGPAVYTVSVATTASEGIVTALVGAGAGADLAGNPSSTPTLGDTAVSLDSHGGDGGSATSLSFSNDAASADGFLEPSDTDTFSFTLSESSTVVIQTTGSTDTRGALTTAAGSPVNDPTADSNSGTGNNFRIEQILVPGTYHLFVTSEGSAQTGTYALSISKTTFPILINELDAQTQSNDTREFVELFDGGSGNTVLDGLVLVFFNGSTDTSYYAIDLDGQSTDANGYFVAGNTRTPNVDLIFLDGSIQPGADAVALYTGNATDFPFGEAVTTAGLLDAVVYDSGQADDSGLLVLLNASEPQLNENANANAAGHSLQRLPNGTGGMRNTSTYSVLSPTPGAANGLPSAPGGLDLTSASDSGDSQTDDLTNDDTPTIVGTARPGSIVTLTGSFDGVVGTGVTGTGGAWSITTSTLSEGAQDFTASADGSADSAALSIEIDVTAPSAPTGVDLLAASDSGTSDTDNITNIETPTISGDAETNSTIALNSNLDGAIGSGAANSPWSITTSSLQGGTHNITATATDAAGNESSASSALGVAIDTTPPTATVNVAPGQNDPAFTGPIRFAAAFSEAIVGFESNDVSTGGNAAGTVSISGGPSTYTIEVTTTAEEGFVTASIVAGSVTDLAGNTSTTDSGSTDNQIDLDIHDGTGSNPTVVPFTDSQGRQVAYLYTGDTDIFSFTLTEPRHVTINTTGNVDTFGRLKNALDSVINNPNADDDLGDAENFQINQPLSTGTFTIEVTSKGATTSGTYELEITLGAVATFQPDNRVGKSAASAIGDNVYATTVGQTLNLPSRKARTVRGVATIENDGELVDDFLVHGRRGTGLFKVTYTSSAGNITAALTAGTYRTGNLDPGDPAHVVTATVKPNKKKIIKKVRRGGKRKKIVKRKRITLTITGTSGADAAKSDSSTIRVQTK